MKKLLLLAAVCVLGLFGSLKAQETISIGSGDAAINYSPTYVDVNYGVTQQLFTASEMQNKSGEITSVAFKCTSRSTTRTFKVYMVNTDKTSFNGSSDWVAVTTSDLVYEGSVTFNAGEWTTITFQTPFIYKSGKNVMLCVNDVTGSWQSLVTKYASEGRSENRMLYANGYSEIFATDLSLVSGTLKNEVNQVQFTLVAGESGDDDEPTPTLATPTNLSATALSETEIRLSWDAVEGAVEYNVYEGEEVIGTLAQTSVDMTDLDPGTEYCFSVTAVDGENESAKSAPACATTETVQTVATTFSFDFNDGAITGMHTFQGYGATGFSWVTPQMHNTIDVVVENLKAYYKGVDGSIAVYSMTHDLLEDAIRIPDNYIVTNGAYLITETSTLEWDIRQAEDGKSDNYSIVISEDGTNFVDIWFERYGNKTGETKAYSLVDYVGKEVYIGFHHYQQTDGGALCLDNVKLVIDSQITPEDPVDPTAPAIPDNVKAVAFSESTIKLTWNAAENATSYNIYYGEDVVATSVTETSYMVENLDDNTTYCFTVTAVNGEKESAKSSETCATTFEATPEAPAAPTNLEAKPLTDSTIELTWDAVEDAKTYNVYQGMIKLITVAEPTHIVTGLQAGKEFCFTVTAINKGGESPKSAQACATTLVEEGFEKPAIPQNFTVQAVVKGELRLTWDAVEGADEYNIYEGDEVIGTIVQTSVDMTDLDSNKEYCFSVTAVNKGGESDKTEEVCETTLEDAASIAPQNLTVMALIHNELRLSWDEVEGATKYKVYQFDELLGSISNTTVDIYNLADDTEYCFSVSAIIGGEETAKSEEVCETTLKGESIVELTSSINIYPNPVNDRLYIETEVEVREVVVYDVFGRQQTTDNGQQTFIDVTNLNSGIYFVKVVAENGEVVKRFVKK